MRIFHVVCLNCSAQPITILNDLVLMAWARCGWYASRYGSLLCVWNVGHFAANFGPVTTADLAGGTWRNGENRRPVEAWRVVVSSTIRLNVRCCHGSQCIRGGQRGAELVCSAAADLWLSGCKLQPLSQLPAAAAAGGLLAAGPESRYLEWHQIYKSGKQWVMFYEGYNGGTRWGADIAFSNSLTSGWQKRPIKQIDQTKWGNYSDALMYHVATPAIYHIGHRWILYFQAASSGFYSVQHWALYGLELKGFPEKYLSDATVHP